MLYRLFIITVLAFVGFTTNGQAIVQPPVDECPCDSADTFDGLTGLEILDMVCPGGELAEGADLIFDQNEVSVSTSNPDKSYSVSGNFIGRPIFSCSISDSSLGRIIRLPQETYELCRRNLIRACDISFVRPVPTVSEWGLIAMAGVIGLAGFIAIRRRKAEA